MKCQYYVTDSPRYTDCKPCSKFRLYTSGRCKNCVFNIPTFFKVFLEQYFHSQVLFRTDYFIMTLRAYYVVPNWHVRCNNTSLHVTFKYTNIPFWALKCALANYAPPILCFLSLPHEHSMTSMLNFIPNVMRQASLSLRPPIIAPPFSENPPSREPKQAGSWVGHASRASHRMWGQYIRKHTLIGDSPKPRDSTLLIAQSAEWIAQAIF